MLNDQITTFNTLKPQMVRAIREVFDDAVCELERRRGEKAPPLSDKARAELAKRIVELAKHGECDASRLKEAALEAPVG